MRESTQQFINFAEILEMIKKRWLFILIVTLIATITTGILSAYVLEPKYLTRAKVFIGKDESIVEGYNSSDIQMYQKLLKTYSETIQTTDLVERAIERSQYNITIESVLKSLNVLPVTDTQILEVEYESEDPAEAKDTLSRIVSEFINTSKELVPNGSVTVIQRVRLPQAPSSPNLKMNMAIAFVLGLMASIGVIILMEYMDNTYKTREKIERQLNIPVIGIIPHEQARWE